MYNNEVIRSIREKTKGAANIVKAKNLVQLALLVVGTGMVAYGAGRGEAAVVLGKAIKLCLECVGIG